jgi:hypothetical protein
VMYADALEALYTLSYAIKYRIKTGSTVRLLSLLRRQRAREQFYGVALMCAGPSSRCSLATSRSTCFSRTRGDLRLYDPDARWRRRRRVASETNTVR